MKIYTIRQYVEQIYIVEAESEAEALELYEDGRSKLVHEYYEDYKIEHAE